MQQIMDEARKQYINIPSGMFLAGLGDDYNQKVLTEGERFALCYFKGALLTLASNNLLCDDWESKIVLDLKSETSEQAVEE